MPGLRENRAACSGEAFLNMIHWRPIRTDQDWEDLLKHSFDDDVRAVAVFKHSTRCSISSMVLNRLERDWENTPEIPTYFLDLIAFRAISNRIAEESGVVHESPQLLLFKAGECFAHASHTAIHAGMVNEH